MAMADPRTTAPRAGPPRPSTRDAAARGARQRGWLARPLTAGHVRGPAPTRTEFTGQVTRGVAVVRVTGEVDMANRDGLLATIMLYVRDDRVHGVVVDLDGVSFLDCTGVSALLAGRRAAVAGRRDFEVVNPQPSVLRVLRLTSTLEVLGGSGGHAG